MTEATPVEPNDGQAQRAREAFGDEAVDAVITEFGLPEPGTPEYAKMRGRFAHEDDLEARATAPDEPLADGEIIDLGAHDSRLIDAEQKTALNTVESAVASVDEEPLDIEVDVASELPHDSKTIPDAGIPSEIIGGAIELTDPTISGENKEDRIQRLAQQFNDSDPANPAA